MTHVKCKVLCQRDWLQTGIESRLSQTPTYQADAEGEMKDLISGFNHRMEGIHSRIFRPGFSGFHHLGIMDTTVRYNPKNFSQITQ